MAAGSIWIIARDQPWVLDIDTTVKPLYRHQEGAVVSYNPHKPGRPSNSFDELKNHWGWGGFTTHDLKRCRSMARCVALVFNWWNLFVRLADPDHHREAVTSRPLLLQAIGRQTKHAGRTTVTITSTHGDHQRARRALTRIAAFFTDLRRTAEQLTVVERWYRILSHALVKYLRGRQLVPPKLLPAGAASYG